MLDDFARSEAVVRLKLDRAIKTAGVGIGMSFALYYKVKELGGRAVEIGLKTTLQETRRDSAAYFGY